MRGGIDIGEIGWGLLTVNSLTLGLFGALEHTSEVREWEGLTLLTGWKTGMLTYMCSCMVRYLMWASEGSLGAIIGYCRDRTFSLRF